MLFANDPAITLIKTPLYNESIPSYLYIVLNASKMPLYGGIGLF